MSFDPEAQIDVGKLNNKISPEAKDTSSSLGLIDRGDFKAFQAQDIYPKDGTYSFTVFRDELNKATSLITHVIKAGISHFKPCKITLYPDMVRLSTGNHNAMCEVFAQAKVQAEGIEDNAYSFILDHEILHRIAGAFSDEILFEFDAKHAIVRVHSGETHVEVSIADSTEFPDYHRRFNDPVRVSSCDTHLLYKSLGYNLMFSQSGSMAQAMNQVSIRDGSMVSGADAALGVSCHEDFKDVQLAIPATIASLTHRVMGMLDKEHSEFYDLGNGYILLRDHTIFYIFPQFELSFPDVAGILEKASDEEIWVERTEFLNSLNRLSVVNNPSEMRVRIRTQKDTQKMHVETKDPSGKVSKDVIIYNGSGRDVDVFVTMKRLMQLLSHFSAANVGIRFAQGDNPKAMFIDNVDPSCDIQTTSIFSVLTEAQVHEKEMAQKVSDSKQGIR